MEYINNKINCYQKWYKIKCHVLIIFSDFSDEFVAFWQIYGISNHFFPMNPMNLWHFFGIFFMIEIN